MNSIRITAVGDLILARRMHRYYERGDIHAILNDTQPILRDSDLNICNLETIITNVGRPYPKKEKNPYYYRCSTKLAKFLIEANIHAVTTANNHAMDYGVEGLLFQNRFLEQIGIASAGSGQNLESAMRPVYVKVGEVIVSIISFCSAKPRTLGATRERAGTFYFGEIENISGVLEPIIQEAKNNSDFVIVSPHWTENWVTEPKNELRVQARNLIDYGCDAIFGHSSHLLLGIEIYRNKPIIYDMGTFLVDTIAGNRNLKYSAIFQLKVVRYKLSCLEIFPVLLDAGQVRSADTKAFSYVHDKLLSLENNGLSSAERVVEGNKIAIQFSNDQAPYRRKKTSSQSIRIYDVTSISSGSADFDAKPSCVTRASKLNNSDYSPIELKYGYRVLGYHAVESFRAGSGFHSILIFEVGGKAYKNIEIHIKGVSNYGKKFDEFHPVSNGVYNSLHWEKGEVVTDEVCVRVNRRVEPGKYTLYCGFFDTETKEYIETIDGKSLFEVSKIYVLPELISNTASGIDWSGVLDENVKLKFEEEFVKQPELYLFENIRGVFHGHANFEKNFSLRAIENKYGFDSSISLVYMTLFQKHVGSIRWGSRRKELKLSLLRNIEKLKSKKNYDAFSIKDRSETGIFLEIVTEKVAHDISELLSEDKLYLENGDGFELIYETKVDELITSAECGYYQLSTNRQKIAFALLKNGVSDFEDLEVFMDTNADKISYKRVKTVALVDYKGVVDEYTVFRDDIENILYS